MSKTQWSNPRELLSAGTQREGIQGVTNPAQVGFHSRLQLVVALVALRGGTGGDRVREVVFGLLVVAPLVVIVSHAASDAIIALQVMRSLLAPEPSGQ